MEDTHTYLWRQLRSPELAALAKDDAVVLLPVGAVEQHGPHLPVETDSRLAEEVSLRAAAALQPVHPIIVAPTVWAGLSEHHMAYPGTISVRFETFAGILHDVCETIQRHGFQRIMIINGHGGNIAALQVVVGELTRNLQYPVRGLTYCHLQDCAVEYSRILEDQENVLHAGEAETSMMLALASDRIDQDAMLTSPNGAFAYAADADQYQFLRFDQLTETGVNGFTKNATSEKGERLLDAGAKAVSRALCVTFGIGGQSV